MPSGGAGETPGVREQVLNALIERQLIMQAALAEGWW